MGPGSEGDRALEGSDSLAAAREAEEPRKKSLAPQPLPAVVLRRCLSLPKVSVHRGSFPCPEPRRVLNLWTGGAGLGKSRAQKLAMPCASVQCYDSDMFPQSPRAGNWVPSVVVPTGMASKTQYIMA